MKKSVFTLLTVMVLSTSTVSAQRHDGRVATNGNGQRMERPCGGRGDDMYGVARNGGRPMQGHQPHDMRGAHHPHSMRGGHPAVHVVNHPPRVVEHVVYSAPVPPMPAPVPPPPPSAPVPPPPHPAHVSPAGVVAGAVIGTVIGALICH